LSVHFPSKKRLVEMDEGVKHARVAPLLLPRLVSSESNPAESVNEECEKAEEEALSVEPLLVPNPDRYILFPIRYPDVWKMYKDQEACIWSADEIDMKQDHTDWRSRTNARERRLALGVLSFFATADGMVGENLITNFSSEVQVPEVRQFWNLQGAMEDVHQETYGRFLELFTEGDSKLQYDCFHASQKEEYIHCKAAFGEKYMSRDIPFATRLIAFAIIEGIFFSASFCVIFWFKKNNRFPGLCHSNDFIARDEGLHRDFACLLLRNHIRHRPAQTVVHDMIREAVACERAFVQHALAEPLPDLHAEAMCRYVEFCADHLLFSMGYDRLYHETNPFPWMNLISMDNVTNFFEQKVSEYAQAHVGKSQSEISFRTDEDF